MNSDSSKIVYIVSITYWKAKKYSGYFSSSEFDNSCGIKYSSEENVDNPLRFLAFIIVNNKKFQYACLKYEFDYVYKE